MKCSRKWSIKAKIWKTEEERYEEYKVRLEGPTAN